MPKTKIEEIEIVAIQGKKSKYPYENLSVAGGYFEVTKNNRTTALTSTYYYIGRHHLNWQVSLGKKGEQYVIVRVA